MKKAKRRDIRKIPVRFNYYFDGKTQKVTLKPGEEYSLSFRRPTDEGFQAEHVTLSLEGRVIVERYLSEGRDCDGLIRHTGERTCPVSDRAALIPDRRNRMESDRRAYPRFQQVEDDVYDELAQKSGY